MADLSAHGKANPCGHPTCRFVGKTTGRIDSRLILPKLHLAILDFHDGEHLTGKLLNSLPLTMHPAVHSNPHWTSILILSLCDNSRNRANL